jgi:cyanophycinase-like exopeptidase
MKLNPLFLLLLTYSLQSQSYTSYFSGNTNDTLVSGLPGGVCLMGGASEHDDAMKWFLQQCQGGDVLVLRASGSNGYNAYLYNQLGIKVNSVETIVCHSANASNDSYLHQKINQAEGIWFAGGDQWDYVSYWRNTPIDSLINLGIQSRKIVIGGTSAGMAILGGYYFTARNGTVTSAAAMNNPYTGRVTVDSNSFIHAPFMQEVITDTHYDNPDRKGRHVAFMARILTDYRVEAKGIACDEYTAVCIDAVGIARTYGDYPGNDDNAYFIQPNCELESRAPEQCSTGLPLTWNLDESALKVYAVKGTPGGTNTFDLSDWIKGTGGEWQNWYVENNTLYTTESDRIHCQPSSATPIPHSSDALKIYPNPYQGGHLMIEYKDQRPHAIYIHDMQGTRIWESLSPSPDRMILNDPAIIPGVYIVSLLTGNICLSQKLVVCAYDHR